MIGLTFLFGIMGTAVGIVLGEALIAIMMILEAGKAAGFSDVRRVTVTVIAVFGMGLAGPLLGGSGMAVLLVVLLLGYVVAVMGVGGFSRKDIRYLRERVV